MEEIDFLHVDLSLNRISLLLITYQSRFFYSLLSIPVEEIDFSEHKIYWQDIHSGSEHSALKYDGVPYVNVGRIIYQCQFGEDLKKKTKKKKLSNAAGGDGGGGMIVVSRNGVVSGETDTEHKVCCLKIPSNIYVM